MDFVRENIGVIFKAELDSEILELFVSLISKSTHTKEGTFCNIQGNGIEMGMLCAETKGFILNLRDTDHSLEKIAEINTSYVINFLIKEREMLFVQVDMEIYIIKPSMTFTVLKRKISRCVVDENIKRHLKTEDVKRLLNYFYSRHKLVPGTVTTNKKRKGRNRIQRLTNSLICDSLNEMGEKANRAERFELPRPDHSVQTIRAYTIPDMNDQVLCIMSYPTHGAAFNNPLTPTAECEPSYPVQASDTDMGELSMSDSPYSSLAHLRSSDSAPSISASTLHHQSENQTYYANLAISGAGYRPSNFTVPRTDIVRASTDPPMKYPDFADYTRRLESFYNGQWSADKPSPTDLADLGLFLKEGSGDLTRCFQCGIGFKDWSQCDDPLKERVKYSHECPFLVEKIGKERIQALKLSMANGGNAVGGSPHDMKSPRYQTMNARIDSFRDFPGSGMITPQQFAIAGLYYTGIDDLCRCFTCDGGLKRWDVDDDPMVEHALYFPNCAYINRLKGRDFVQRIQREHKKNTPTPRNQIDHKNSTPSKTGVSSNTYYQTAAMGNQINGAFYGTCPSASQTSTPGSEVQGSKHDIESQVQNMRLSPNNEQYGEHTISQVSQKLGFSEAEVARARIELDIKGNRQPTMDDIMNMLLDIKESEEREEQRRKYETEHGPSIDTMKQENATMLRQMYCMLCVTEEANTLFLPCTHHRVCTSCAKEITICPVCNLPIAEKVRTYRS